MVGSKSRFQVIIGFKSLLVLYMVTHYRQGYTPHILSLIVPLELTNMLLFELEGT